jgi:four helix bundle protein
MNKQHLQERAKKFNVAIIKFCDLLPKNTAGFELAKQLIRSSGSVGANYRATARAKSYADFTHKLTIVLEEADESKYWLEVIKEAGITNGSELDRLNKEADELTAIFNSAEKTARSKLRQ